MKYIGTSLSESSFSGVPGGEGSASTASLASCAALIAASSSSCAAASALRPFRFASSRARSFSGISWSAESMASTIAAYASLSACLFRRLSSRRMRLASLTAAKNSGSVMSSRNVLYLRQSSSLSLVLESSVLITVICALIRLISCTRSFFCLVSASPARIASCTFRSLSFRKPSKRSASSSNICSDRVNASSLRSARSSSLRISACLTSSDIWVRKISRFLEMKSFRFSLPWPSPLRRVSAMSSSLVRVPPMRFSPSLTPRGEETSASAAAIVPPCRDTKVVFSNTLRDC